MNKVFRVSYPPTAAPIRGEQAIVGAGVGANNRWGQGQQSSVS